MLDCTQLYQLVNAARYAAYTREAWAAMVKNPQNREEAVKPVIERLGGSVKGLWLAFGEYDAVAIVEMPDNTSAAAFSAYSGELDHRFRDCDR